MRSTVCVILLYREALSPVNEILTLVTSPSSVPFVPSSPVKSKPTSVTLDEISLECDENLLEVSMLVQVMSSTDSEFKGCYTDCFNIVSQPVLTLLATCDLCRIIKHFVCLKAIRLSFWGRL